MQNKHIEASMILYLSFYLNNHFTSGTVDKIFIKAIIAQAYLSIYVADIILGSIDENLSKKFVII